MDTEVYSSSSQEQTNKLGATFSSRITRGDVVAFYGDLGSGKTEFIKGICEGMKVEEIVSSPTYTIINQYEGLRNDDELLIQHIDLYRIESPAEFVEIGLEEILADPESIKLIEWSEHAEMILPPARYEIHFQTIDENTRRIEIIHRNAAAVESAGDVHRLS